MEKLWKIFMLVIVCRQAMQHLEAVGMYAQNIVRAWFTNPNNGWASNSPLTIAKNGTLP